MSAPRPRSWATFKASVWILGFHVGLLSSIWLASSDQTEPNYCSIALLSNKIQVGVSGNGTCKLRSPPSCIPGSKQSDGATPLRIFVCPVSFTDAKIFSDEASIVMGCPCRRSRRPVSDLDLARQKSMKRMLRGCPKFVSEKSQLGNWKTCLSEIVPKWIHLLLRIHKYWGIELEKTRIQNTGNR